MEQLMCVACGEFVSARVEEGRKVPLRSECPACGGTEFKDTETGARLVTDEE
jgi:predicted RNA-binding Zn-ribbon protein involved in translation (DUF1610 family)